jgi:hypothetical protein
LIRGEGLGIQSLFYGNSAVQQLYLPFGHMKQIGNPAS